MEEICLGLCRNPSFFSQESAGVGLGILGIDIKQLIGRGKLAVGIVDMILHGFWRPRGFRATAWPLLAILPAG
jgi:hypothetical protein